MLQDPIGVLSSVGGVVDTLTAVLVGAPATTQPTYSVVYEHADGRISEAVGLLTGSTAVSMLTGSSGDRKVSAVHIYNTDTASVTVTLAKTVAGVSYPLVKQAIPVGGVLHWSKDRGVEVLTAAGVASAETVGAVVAGIGVTAVESGNGPYRKTRLTLVNCPITLTDALAYAGLKLYDFPDGRLRILDCVASLTFTTHSAILTTLNGGVTCSWGIGSVTASSITLATTMMNMLPGSGESVKAFTSSTVIDVAPTAVTGILAAVSGAQLGAILDGTATAVDLYLNVSAPNNAGGDIDGDASLLVNGTIEITWVNGGDL